MLKRISLVFMCILTIQLGYSQCQTIIPSIDPFVTGTIEIDATTGEEIVFYDICQGESIFFDGDVEFITIKKSMYWQDLMFVID